jgi:RNase P protein component
MSKYRRLKSKHRCSANIDVYRPSLLETVSSRKRLLNHLVNGVAGRKVTRELTNRNMKKRAVRHALDTDDTYPIDQFKYSSGFTLIV